MELDVGQSPVLASVQQNVRNLRIESWDLQQTDSTDIQTQPTKIGCYDGGQWRRFAGQRRALLVHHAVVCLPLEHV